MEIMFMLSVVISVIGTGIITILAFIVGARTQQKANRDEEIKLPTINPIKAYEEYQDKKMIEQAEKEADIMLENINNYDGTGLGQKDIK